jgi:Spy/CpxP family protein refolding chaperone
MRNGAKVTAVGVATGFLLAAVVAGAQPAARKGERRPREFEGPAKHLGLSEQQKEAFRQVHEKQRPQMEALHVKMRENREQLRKALEAASPDPVAVGELAIEGHRLRKQGRALGEETDKKLRALLTPEQQVKFDAMNELRRGMGPRGDGPIGDGPMGRHGKGRPPFGPPDGQEPPQE